MYFAAKQAFSFVYIYTVMGTVFTFVLCSLFRVYFPQKVSLIVHIPFTTFPAGCSIIKSQQGNKSPAVNLLKPQITVNTLTSLLPLSHNLSQAQKDRRSDAAVFLLGGRTAVGEGRPRMGRPDR